MLKRHVAAAHCTQAGWHGTRKGQHGATMAEPTKRIEISTAVCEEELASPCPPPLLKPSADHPRQHWCAIARAHVALPSAAKAPTWLGLRRSHSSIAPDLSPAQEHTRGHNESGLKLHVGCSGPTPACYPPHALSQPEIEGQYMMVSQVKATHLKGTCWRLQTRPAGRWGSARGQSRWPWAAAPGNWGRLHMDGWGRQGANQGG